MKPVFCPVAGRVLLCLALVVLLGQGGAAALAGGLPAAPTASNPSLPGWVLNPGNGHYYALVISEEISWPDASDQAGQMALEGCQGRLATVTSAAENDFLADSFEAEFLTSGLGFWLGGFQKPGVEPPDAGWQWVTGEPWSYTNWNIGEPNDAHGPASEQHLDLFAASEVAVGVWNDEALVWNIRGFIVECDPTWVSVSIDIKPGSWPNSLNLAARGVVPVALLTTADFDASTADPGAVRFAGAAPVRWALADVDSDGDTDLVFHFKTQDLDLTRSATEATLKGLTFAGKRFAGADSVRIVPKTH